MHGQSPARPRRRPRRAHRIHVDQSIRTVTAAIRATIAVAVHANHSFDRQIARPVSATMSHAAATNSAMRATPFGVIIWTTSELQCFRKRGEITCVNITHMQLFDPPYQHPSRTLNRSNIPSLKADRADGHRNPIRSLHCTVRISSIILGQSQMAASCRNAASTAATRPSVKSQTTSHATRSRPTASCRETFCLHCQLSNSVDAVRNPSRCRPVPLIGFHAFMSCNGAVLRRGSNAVQANFALWKQQVLRNRTG